MRKTPLVAGMIWGLVGIVGVGVSSPPVWAQDVVRQGVGERRQQLDAMELKPFPASAWGHLSEWIGDAVEVSPGEPALIVTFASWYPPSMTGLSVAQRMADRYAADGLKVIAVHDPRGYAEAEEELKQRSITVPVALDKEGKFRGALKSDGDPDFYVIDRAGRLRYADIETRSVPTAVQTVVRESRDAATELPERLAEARAAAERARQRTGMINPEVNLADLPDFDPMVPPEMYESANWPTRWTEFEERELNRRGRRGETDEMTLAVPPEIEHFGQPLRTSGRATVVYLWFPDVLQSYQRVQPQMDQLAREKGRDVAVVGLLTPTPQSTRNRATAEEAAAEAVRAQRFENHVRNAKSQRRYDHTIVVDREGAVLSQILGDTARSSRSGPPYTPLTAIFSSDGRLRWIGPPTSSHFDSALERVLRSDPGVRMRRTLEEQFIRERGG